MAGCENVDHPSTDELTTSLVQRVNQARLVFKRLKAFELKTGYSDPLSFLADLEKIPLLLDDLPIQDDVAFIKTDSTSLNDISIMGHILIKKYINIIKRLESKLVSTNTSDPFQGDVWKEPRIRENILGALHSVAEIFSRRIPNDNSVKPTNQYNFVVSFQRYISKAKRELIIYEKRSAVTAKPGASFNRYFIVPRAATNIYTGYATQQAKLHTAFRDATFPGQRIFVIYGPEGCGKTELALKYAEDARDQFWGVFFIDGSSRAAALRSYIEIARVARAKHTQDAVVSWLTSQVLPWLLIIDNAGDALTLASLLPTSENGCVLITKRDDFQKYGSTSGDAFLRLPPLGEEEAVDLILKAAQKPTPGPEKVRQEARRTAQATGYLPLALVMAGKMIRYDIYSWVDYIFSHQYHKYIMAKHHHGPHNMWKALISGHDIDRFNLFATFETSYRRLEIEQRQSSKDACELLLKLFTYSDSRRISLNRLITAALEFEVLAKGGNGFRTPSVSVTDLITVSDILTILGKPGGLPEAMKNHKNLDPHIFRENVRTRLSKAMETLLSYSLIIKDDWPERRYSTHPIVYQWLQERSTMLVTEKHVSPLRRSEVDRLDYATDHVYNNDTWQRDTKNLPAIESSKSSISSLTANKEPDMGLYIVSALSLAFAESDRSYLSTQHRDSSQSKPDTKADIGAMTIDQDIGSITNGTDKLLEGRNDDIPKKVSEEGIEHNKAAADTEGTPLSRGRNEEADDYIGSKAFNRSEYLLPGALAYSTTLPQFLDSILEMIPFRYTEPPVPPGQTRVKWKCRCGANLFDDFIEVEPGSLQKLQDSLQHSDQDGESNTVSQKIHSLRGTLTTANYALNWLIQSLSMVYWGDTTTLPLHQSTSTDTPPTPLRPPGLLYLLFCTHAGETGSKLHQERLTNINSDRELLLFLRDAYKTYRKVFSWLTLRDVTSVSLARFMVDSSEFTEIHRHAHVCTSDCICLPPVDRVGTEYNCHPAPEVKPKYFPAIGSRYLTHHFTHPNCVRPTQRFIYNQLPKRTCGQLLAPEDQVEFGWGIYFEEGWHWRSIYFVIVVLIASASVVFGITWSVTKGDVQGGFAVSSVWITLGSLLLGYIAVRSF